MATVFDAATDGIIPSTRVCRVHLFRHPEVLGASERLCRGHVDVDLSDRGRAQVAVAAARWPGPYDAVYSSDLTRCAQLAAALGAPSTTPLLREQDMGRWEGRTWADLTAEDPAGTTAYWDDYVNAKPPGGESFGEAAARVVAWWAATEPTLPHSAEVAIVTHIGSIRALLCAWMGMPVSEGLRWAPGYATHTEVLLADAGAVIVAAGERAR